MKRTQTFINCWFLVWEEISCIKPTLEKTLFQNYNFEKHVGIVTTFVTNIYKTGLFLLDNS